MSSVALEVCVDSLEVIDIVQFGSNRFEVCSNLIHGLTPSIGLINAILQRYPGTRIMAMVRPRIGSFVYTDAELVVMEQDILSLKAAGVMGVVFGCLTDNGEVDVPACQRLASAARPLDITFHRAIDVTNDSVRSFNNIASVEGITRILTSGLASTISLGSEQALKLSSRSANLEKATGQKLGLVLGSGISAETMFHIKNFLWFSPHVDIHLTGSRIVREYDESRAGQKGESFGFGRGEKWVLDREKVWAVWGEVKNWNPQRGLL